MFLLTLILSSLMSRELICGLDNRQINLLQNVYQVANKYKAMDGHVFNDTVVAIYLTESDAGKNIIGDKNKLFTGRVSLLDASLGPGQVRLITALEMLDKYNDKFPRQYQYLKHPKYHAYKKFLHYKQKTNYYKRIFNKYSKKEHKTQRDLRVIKWSLREYRYWKSKYKKYWNNVYKAYYRKDIRIMNLLLSDPEFYITVSTLKLIDGYDTALKKKMWNPWFKAISRYNGGWKNKQYYQRVIRKMKIVRCLKRHGYLK